MEAILEPRRIEEKIPIGRSIALIVGLLVASAVPICLLLMMIAQDRQGSQFVAPKPTTAASVTPGGPTSH